MNHHGLTPAITMLIPIVAIVFGISLAMFSIYIDFKRKREILKTIHLERMAAIEKGLDPPELPAEIFSANGPKQPRSPARTMERALILMFLGIAIGVALWRTGSSGAWWGLVPFALGLAYLISSRFRATEPTRTAPQAAPSRLLKNAALQAQLHERSN